jgi:regulator of RNase E activity RraA
MTTDKPTSAALHPGPGFRVRTRIPRPAPDVVAGFCEFETPAASDLMNRLYTMRSEIRTLTDPDVRLVGPACTVKVFPGDNLMVHKSLDVARPGDVIVIDAGGSPMNAVLGDLISTKARHRGVAGFIVDGLIRDLPAILALGDFPVFARGVTPIGPLHRGPGEINHPICCGGIVVNPGDIVMGDLNGIVVVPREIAEDILASLRAKAAGEADYTAAVVRGEFSNAWVDRLLEQSGMPAERIEAVVEAPVRS